MSTVNYPPPCGGVLLDAQVLYKLTHVPVSVSFNVHTCLNICLIVQIIIICEKN